MAKYVAVYGIYSFRKNAELAITQLKNEGFSNMDISVLVPDDVGSHSLAFIKETKASVGATAGGTTGGFIGGALGWLAGIGLLAIPGVGPFIAAGPIMGLLAGAGALGAIGGVAGALIGMGIPEYEAKRFESRIREGGILLSVHSDDSQKESHALAILRRTGAEDIGTRGEVRETVFSASRG